MRAFGVGLSILKSNLPIANGVQYRCLCREGVTDARPLVLGMYAIGAGVHCRPPKRIYGRAHIDPKRPLDLFG